MRRLFSRAALAVAAALVLPAVAAAQPPTNAIAPTLYPPVAHEYVGGVVSDNGGGWTPPVTAIVFQWLDCDASGQGCVPIPGATSQSYTIKSSDVGHTLRVQETAYNGTEASAPAQSAPSPVVTPQPVPVNYTSQPVITGRPAIGQTLSVSTGTWTGTPPITFTYQWQRCGGVPVPGKPGTFQIVCKDIPGATKRTYTVAVADGARYLLAVVTATNPVGSYPLPAKLATQPVPEPPRTLTDSLQDAVTVQPFGVGPTVTAAQLLAAGGFRVSFTAFGPGTFTIRWTTGSSDQRVLASGRHVFPRRGTATVRIKLTPLGRKQLRHNHRLHMHLLDAFTAPGRHSRPHTGGTGVLEQPNGSFTYVGY
jgi:hypothetical protein